MQKQLILIDDRRSDIELALKMLKLPDDVLIKPVLIDTDVFISPNLRHDPDVQRAFIIDLNLNPGRTEDKEGISIISQLRREMPEILIIAYSGKDKLENEARSAGANYFFQKAPGYTERDFKNMQQIILSYFDHLEKDVRHHTRELNLQNSPPHIIAGNVNAIIRHSAQRRILSFRKQYEAVMKRIEDYDNRLSSYWDRRGEVNPNDEYTLKTINSNIESLEAAIEDCHEKLKILAEKIRAEETLLNQLL